MSTPPQRAKLPLDELQSPKPLALCLFCGLGGGALGLAQAGFETFGIDLDPDALKDYQKLTGHRGALLDLQTAQPHELRALVPRPPDVIFTSPPCQAFSGCLPLSRAGEAPYTALSSLSERGVWLVLEAWADCPPKLIALENVPRIMSRGRPWLDNIALLLAHYGYIWRETSHDCGELGGLAQRRRRFLGVARHRSSCPEWLYEPAKQSLRGVGEVIGQLPYPTTRVGVAGAMHTAPSISALTALRLALIPPGRDWRALPKRVRIQHTASLEAHTLDVRSSCKRREGSLGVTAWDGHTHAIIATGGPHNTGLQVADPRLRARSARQNGGYGVNDWASPSHAVIATSQLSVSWSSVADPRLSCAPRTGAYGVTAWEAPSATVLASACHDNSPMSVADPHALRRPTHKIVCEGGELVLVGPPLDLKTKRAAPSSLLIEALDGSHHRPFTTLELALLQGLPPTLEGAPLKLEGRRQANWRRRIGNAIPVQAAKAIGQELMRTLTASAQGLLLFGGTPIWVCPTEQASRLDNASTSWMEATQ